MSKTSFSTMPDEYNSEDARTRRQSSKVGVQVWWTSRNAIKILEIAVGKAERRNNRSQGMILESWRAVCDGSSFSNFIIGATKLVEGATA